MEKTRQVLNALLTLIVLLGAFAWKGESVVAQDPERKTTITVNYTEFEWWLMSWEDNSILCSIPIDHPGIPISDEVYTACGNDLGEVWENTPPCKPLLQGSEATGECEGAYLHLIASEPKQRDVIIDLPPPTVWVNLEGCTPTPPENLCPEIPILLLTGEEPVPDERILSIQGTIDDEPFLCESDLCPIQLEATPLKGSTIQFSATSSYGDTSDTYTAHVRVIDTGVAAEPDGGGWYVDVISSQLQGMPIASCARIWEAFPPIGGPPTWLTTPEDGALLASEEPYYYLAGRLISQGLVTAADCTSGGLLPNGYADTCGLERARPLVEEWQNLFDERIVEVSQETGVPAQLMKNLFAQESQFWPGIFRVTFEYGLGQVTENGTDAVLLWNDEFFQQFCPLILSEESCAEGYLHLDSESMAILRGALALQAKSDCPDCMTGIDLTHVNFSVSLFANILQANCVQVGQSIRNATSTSQNEEVEPGAGFYSSYEDLWRFTIANYHAGPGCLSYAIYTTWQSGAELTWENVATHFTDPCRGAVPYVEKITRDE